MLPRFLVSLWKCSTWQYRSTVPTRPLPTMSPGNKAHVCLPMLDTLDVLERNPCKIFQVLRCVRCIRLCRTTGVWYFVLPQKWPFDHVICKNSPQLISCNYLLKEFAGHWVERGFGGFCHLATFDAYFWLNRLGTCKRSRNLLPEHISRPHVVWVNHETLLLQCRFALWQDNGHAIEH